MLVEQLEAAGVPTVFLNGRSAWDLLRTIRRLARHLRQQRPQLLQTFLWHANLVGPAAAWWAGVPRVVTGIRVAEQRGRWRLWLERQTACCASRHVCVSRAVAKFAEERMHVDAAALEVIPNGVDLARFEQAVATDHSALGIPAERRLITFVGRLDPQKGIDWLLETSPRWMEALPEYDLVLAGEGPQRAELERQAARAGIAARAHFVGWQANVPGLLKASDLVVLTSRWEGMPNVILEAMAAGRAVLCTEVEGVRELLGDDTEQVVSRDPNAFTQRLICLAQSESRREQLGHSNQSRIAEGNSLDQMVRRYEQLYETLLGPGSA